MFAQAKPRLSRDTAGPGAVLIAKHGEYAAQRTRREGLVRLFSTKRFLLLSFHLEIESKRPAR